MSKDGAEYIVGSFLSSGSIPAGVPVTVLINGLLLTGTAMTSTEFATEVRAAMAASVRPIADGGERLATMFEGVNVDSMGDDESIYFKLDAIMSGSGVRMQISEGPAGSLMRLRRSAVAGLLVGRLGIPS